MEFLIKQQNGEGLWDEERFTATGFPRVFYLCYPRYWPFSTFWAVARSRNVTSANARRVALGM